MGVPGLKYTWLRSRSAWNTSSGSGSTALDAHTEIETRSSGGSANTTGVHRKGALGQQEEARHEATTQVENGACGPSISNNSKHSGKCTCTRQFTEVHDVGVDANDVGPCVLVHDASAVLRQQRDQPARGGDKRAHDQPQQGNAIMQQRLGVRMQDKTAITGEGGRTTSTPHATGDRKHTEGGSYAS